MFANPGAQLMAATYAAASYSLFGRQTGHGSERSQDTEIVFLHPFYWITDEANATVQQIVLAIEWVKQFAIKGHRHGIDGQS